MFGDKPELRGESASLRCATRAHACNGKNLAEMPPGYPTTSSFSAPFSACMARTDACPNSTDGNGSAETDTSVPTSCSPLKSVHRLAEEIKGLKSNPDEQIFVAGIFGWPLSDQDMASATYKIDLVPNPNTADTAHSQIYDYWPVCYDPNHPPANPNVYDATAAGWGATGGLREAAFVDEFGANGLKFSICQPDFTNSMKVIGDALAKKIQNLCLPTRYTQYANCTAHYLTPDASGGFFLGAAPIPQCAGSSAPSQDCYLLASDQTQCPGDQFIVNLKRTEAELAAGPLPTGTMIEFRCQ
jgi:hypothetical protein